MRDPIIKHRQNREREAFIKSLDAGAICNLASSHHNDDPCSVFRPLVHGAFNVCFFIEFKSLPPLGDKPRRRPDRWVVRIPITPRVPWADEKLEAEVATMKYVATKTTIPVPRVHAWAVASESIIGLGYIAMDFIEGQDVPFERFPHTPCYAERRQRIYEQVADVYVQLRGLEFPLIGSLGFAKRAAPPAMTNAEEVTATDTRDVSDIVVRHRPLLAEALIQESEGYAPGEIFPPNETFETASSYKDALLALAYNELDKSRDNYVQFRCLEQIVYGLHEFKRYVSEEWFDRSLENGPFMLMHGDLGFHGGNLLWDKDYNLVAVLDWEYSYTVPVQFFAPPTWLCGCSGVTGLALGASAWMAEMAVFRRLIVQRETALGVPPRLSTEWKKMECWPHPLFALGPTRPESIHTIYWDFLIWKQLGVEPDGPNDKTDEMSDFTFDRIYHFFDENDSAMELLQRKLDEQDKFDDEWDEFARNIEDEPRGCGCSGCQHENLTGAPAAEELLEALAINEDSNDSAL